MCGSISCKFYHHSKLDCASTVIENARHNSAVAVHKTNIRTRCCTRNWQSGHVATQKQYTMSTSPTGKFTALFELALWLKVGSILPHADAFGA